MIRAALAIVAVLAIPAASADPPFFVRDIDDARDVGAVNENFRAVADAARRAQDGVDTMKADLRDDDNTWSGTNTLSSTLTVNGQAIFTSSLTVRGLIFGNVSASTSTTGIPEATFTNTTFDRCVTGSTVTMTTTGRPVVVWFTGSTSINAAVTGAVSFMQDGAFVSPLSSSIGVLGVGTSVDTEVNASFHFLVSSIAAGSHSWCLAVKTPSGTLTVKNDTLRINQFGAYEMK